jgi:AcrR family transcriptional regulator
MLLYHFGSREGLLVAVTQAVEEQQRAALLGSGVGPQDARRSWERLSDPKLWPQERLFFELYAYALRGRPGTEGFLDGIVESWVAPVAAALVEAGTDERTARADARLGVAVVRGLLLDLLATGDRAGVTEAYERFLQHVSATGAPIPPSG